MAASWTIPIQTLIGLEIGDSYNLASSTSPTHGHGAASGYVPISPTVSHGHKRNASTAGLDSSPASGVESPTEHDVNGEDGARDAASRRRPVKRACNECRQQKVSYTNTQAVHYCLSSPSPHCHYTYGVSIISDSSDANTSRLATLRCHPRAIPNMHPLQTSYPRLQDRRQL
jgi:hypothetical protein